MAGRGPARRTFLITRGLMGFVTRYNREETAGDPGGRKPRRGEREGFMGLVWLLVFIGIWVLLQAVVLPKMGVST
jgi:hypothetical protein